MKTFLFYNETRIFKTRSVTTNLLWDSNHWNAYDKSSTIEKNIKIIFVRQCHQTIQERPVYLLDPSSPLTNLTVPGLV
ncbi:hypothetical protein L6452_04404 [Arctium lappa]|uniref:Uncharacterized protein n=1 Tax=Arctium lappa TaxID=4217 RepID=A0ACB9FQW0_ARCLA|nr:hypothetical protein L6452_04404 [Arctium lappa]